MFLGKPRCLLLLNMLGLGQLGNKIIQKQRKKKIEVMGICPILV
jgi:hypothetical protein